MATTSTQARTLVLCFDGTGDMFDEDNTNVVRLFSALEKDNRQNQLVYYQSGLGTYVSPSTTWAPAFRRIARVFDMATACFLESHIMGGYTFLMDNYREGDKICLFGFSRGAYTARCLAGMLQKVGLLPKSNKEQIPFAYACYQDPSTQGRSRSIGFKKAFSVPVDIEFIGVWDTVSSVGIIIPRHLPFACSNNMCLGESYHGFTSFRFGLRERKRYSSRPKPHRVLLDETIAYQPRRSDTADTATFNGTPIEMMMNSELNGWNRETDVKEVWFAGCHADVGGGNATNGTVHSLAGPSLRWMINELVMCNTGIQFNDEGLLRLGINPHRLRQLARDSRKAATNQVPLQESNGPLPSDVMREIADASSTLNDELEKAPFWRLLEVIPIRVSHQDENGTWHRKWKLNLGGPRKIYIPNPLFHSTVKMRMDAGIGYKPRAKFTGDPIFVD